MTALRAIPHGTLSGYQHHRCRCEECRRAKREYVHARGDETTQARREYKRRWEREHLPICVCGRSTGSHRHTRCVDCFRAAQREARDARREVIARLWADGTPVIDIAALLDSTAKSIHWEINAMRAAGYTLPYRRKPKDRV